ncbi:MAG TPA: Spy/CpxP family protein refolding chaperone [Acetobacteraceae bacterium]|jgi:protein CpxP|nr:Spy/CpxP family protein refolding chaperone [Acetobacteraceae bacterium]
MKALLLARAAPTLALTTILAGAVSVTAFAQTTPAPATSSPAASSTPGTAASGSAATTAPAATTATHHAARSHARTAASRTSGETMAEAAEQRITDLHTRLKITAAEQSQWDQFAQVMLDNAKDLDAAYQQRAASFDKMNAVENMQSYAQIEQSRAQDLQKLVPAFQTLYASLSDDQKQAADRLFRNQAAHAVRRHGAATAAAAH